MTTSASTIPEVSAEVASVALIMPDRSGKSTFARQRFIMLTEKEVSLTVWKIIPIKRSFIFGINGVIFTYNIMLYSILNSFTNDY
ncbi:hypothetical protein CEXT_281531 [Caerostris extrusa]|uniref:Uncharacterized protein n=1 Tax=Caerostris extrusa TaxID=172846 RepID=A0AAV4W046_CAEEX|nr:hypothetical protein CEXT_281531 [Caerostris extrusa]